MDDANHNEDKRPQTVDGFEQETCSDDVDEEEESPPQTVDDLEQEEEIVILIVGKDINVKHDVVKMLTERGAWTEEKTPAGVRIYRASCSPRLTVVDTTPLEYIKDKNPVALARRWISQNSLRKIILGKLVLVVCAVTSSITTELCQVTEIFNYNNCWVDVLQLIFGAHKGGTMVLVKTEGDDAHTNLKIRKQIKLFVRVHRFKSKNIAYLNFMEGGKLMTSILNDILCLLNNNSNSDSKQTTWLALSRYLQIAGEKLCPRMKSEGSEFTIRNSTMDLKPFRMKEVSSKNRGPWAPEKVILFGRTGSGKSTLAQLLTSGKLDPNSKRFVVSSSIRGGTSKIEHSEGRGWYIVDTPGLGEPNDIYSTINSDKAESDVKNYVKVKEGIFSHYLFVLMKGRIDQLDQDLWKFFKSYFGAEISRHFSIVISDADRQWLDENIRHLQNSFEGCSNFLCADFPATKIDADLEEIEEDQEYRMKSLEELEYELARLQRFDVPSRFGKNSWENFRTGQNWVRGEKTMQRDKIHELLLGTSDLWFNISYIFSYLSSLFSGDDGVTLEPLEKG